MATPAQVANDLEARARWWLGRSDYVYDACKDAAKLIRTALAGKNLKAERVAAVQHAMIEEARKWRHNDIAAALERGRRCLVKVHGGDFSDV